jgi:ferritin-like metal-binding protein YciE
MELQSLHQLYLQQLQDLYSAETQLLDALPKMVTVTTDENLKRGFSVHLTQTKEQAERLTQILERHATERDGKTCKAMEGILKEGEEFLKQDKTDPNVRDAGLIAAAQRVEHYEIAGYGTVIAYAEQMGYADDLVLLNQSLSEEKETDKLLTEMAEGVVNIRAQ